MNTPRNLWPIGVIAACALFVVGTVGLIVMACSQKNDLVRPDYYEQELRFQSQIDQTEHTRRVAGQASVAFDAGRQCITVSLPPGHAGHTVMGSVELYRPSAARMDRSFKLEPDAKGIQRLDTTSLAQGLWRVRVSWTVEKENYYLEQKVVIGPRTS